MDVRCERCRAQYVFDDDQVTPAGLTVQCTNCGHVFKVKKKELVVTVPVKPDEMESAPLPATAAAPRTSTEGREPVREWRVRQANGNIFTFRELTTLQKWIIERKVVRDDEISNSGEQWKRLGNIAELASFFQVVEAAERGRAQPVPSATPPGVPAMPTFGAPAPPRAASVPPPPSGYPPPSFTMPRAGSQPAPEWRPEPLPGPLQGPLPGPPGPDLDLQPDEIAAVRKGRGGRRALLVLALLVAGAAAAYVFAPQLLQGRWKVPDLLPPTGTVAPTPAPPPGPADKVEAHVPAQPAPAAALPAPAPAGQAASPAPQASAPPEGAAQPPPAPAAKPPAARGPRALLAEAERLREKGELEAALDLYGRVASEDPENVDALTGRGLCYLDLERYPPAEASFQAALKVDPREQDALMGLAETYRWQGKKADAIRYYERFLATDPQGEDAEVARNALEELRK